ncbi:CAP domain-containing protein [Salibacterium salarium]|nr:CAP domain-containing protein [Salibacterium salarium]
MSISYIRVSVGIFLLVLSVMSGCNNGNQGAQDDKNNAMQQIDTENTDENTESEGDTGFPFSLVPNDEGEQGGGEQNPGETIDELIPEDEIGRERDDATEIEPGENQQSEGGNEADTDQAGLEEEVVSLTNAEREKQGLSPLKQDSKLAEVAQTKSEDMSENEYFAHRSPNYGTPFDMLEDFGVEFTVAAENIASGQQTAEQVVEGWMNSEGHRKNIMNENLTHIGIGYEENGRYWTQMFIGK